MLNADISTLSENIFRLLVCLCGLVYASFHVKNAERHKDDLYIRTLAAHASNNKRSEPTTPSEYTVASSQVTEFDGGDGRTGSPRWPILPGGPAESAAQTSGGAAHLYPGARPRPAWRNSSAYLDVDWAGTAAGQDVREGPLSTRYISPFNSNLPILKNHFA